MKEPAKNIPLPTLAVHFVSSNKGDDQLQEIREATKADQEMKHLLYYISEGWPQKKSELPINLRPYWNYRDELTQENGVIFKSYKVLIPDQLRASYKEKIHEHHQGIERSVAKAQEQVFWPGYTQDIKEFVEKCRICQETPTVCNKKIMYASFTGIRWTF